MTVSPATEQQKMPWQNGEFHRHATQNAQRETRNVTRNATNFLSPSAWPKALLMPLSGIDDGIKPNVFQKVKKIVHQANCVFSGDIFVPRGLSHVVCPTWYVPRGLSHVVAIFDT